MSKATLESSVKGTHGKDLKEVLQELSDKDYSVADAAKNLGCSLSTIRVNAIKFGVTFKQTLQSERVTVKKKPEILDPKQLANHQLALMLLLLLTMIL